jgi:hypothetical protein
MRKLKSKIQILNEMWKTIGILMFKEEKTQEEIDLLYICTEFFNSAGVTKFINMFEQLTPQIGVPGISVPDQFNMPYTPQPDSHPSDAAINEGLAMFTGMAIGGVSPIGNTFHSAPVDTGLESTQMAEFHKMMDGI